MTSFVQGAAYRKMKQDVLDTLKAAMPLDGVAIQLHGAGVLSGRWLPEEVPELLGKDVSAFIDENK